MCIICVQLQQRRLTVKEAMRNFSEIKHNIDKEHQVTVWDLIYEEIQKEQNKKFDYEPYSED